MGTPPTSARATSSRFRGLAPTTTNSTPNSGLPSSTGRSSSAIARHWNAASTYTGGVVADLGGTGTEPPQHRSTDLMLSRVTLTLNVAPTDASCTSIISAAAWGAWNRFTS